MTGPCHAVQDLTDFLRYQPNRGRNTPNLFFGDGFKGSDLLTQIYFKNVGYLALTWRTSLGEPQNLARASRSIPLPLYLGKLLNDKGAQLPQSDIT